MAVLVKMTVKSTILLIILAFIILPAIASASPEEVYGRVSHLVDGETFDLLVGHGDNRVSAGDTIRIRLADIDCPETRGAKACPEGKAATEYTSAWLPGQYVFLDLDDKAGNDPYGRWVAVGIFDSASLLNPVEPPEGIVPAVVDVAVALQDEYHCQPVHQIVILSPSSGCTSSAPSNCGSKS